MANRQSPSLLRQLRILFASGTEAGLSDRELLDRFRDSRAAATGAALDAEAAFSILVERHGAMVWGVCRRVLGDVHEAEDAFQATFLLLVRKAGTVRVDDSLGRWLHGVAQRVALRARAEAARRESVPQPDLAPARSPGDPAESAERHDQALLLAEEIGRLPDRYRCAIDLCCLQGMSLDQASHALNWPVATVKSRLARGRLRLKERMARRGLASATAGAFVALSGSTRAAMPPGLVRSTLDVGAAASAASIPTGVTTLMEGVLKMMMREKMTQIAAALVLGIGLAAGALAQQAAKAPGPAADPHAAGPRRAPPPAEPARGDPRWTATFPNGATFEVVGVSVHPSGPGTWWKPDGTKLAQAPCDRSTTIQTSVHDVISRAIVVRISNIPRGAAEEWWINGAHGGSQQTTVRLAGKPVPGLGEVVTFLDRGQKTCTVEAKVAAGPWKTVQDWGTSPGARGARDGLSFVFSVPIATRKGTVLSVTHDIRDQEVRLVATDRGGKEHVATTLSGSGARNFHQIVGEFDLPPDAIEEFHVQVRGYDRLEIPGIALDPSPADAAAK